MDAREPTEGVVPPSEWPSQGRIEFKDLRVRYAADLPEVLHGVTCSIEVSGEGEWPVCAMPSWLTMA
jgi:ABC-type bacteriocin/lantibiotic exporter with double-glycine peptidase domain